MPHDSPRSVLHARPVQWMRVPRLKRGVAPTSRMDLEGQPLMPGDASRGAMAGGVRIQHPVELSLAHPTLTPHGIFQLTKAFDAYELRKVPGDKAGRIKDLFAVDVLENKPASTTIRITPARPLSYESLSERIREMIRIVTTGMFESPVRIERIVWDVQDVGTASDLRESRDRIR